MHYSESAKCWVRDCGPDIGRTVEQAQEVVEAQNDERLQLAYGYRINEMSDDELETFIELASDELYRRDAKAQKDAIMADFSKTLGLLTEDKP